MEEKKQAPLDRQHLYNLGVYMISFYLMMMMMIMIRSS